MNECIWDFHFGLASLCTSIGVALSDVYVPFAALEETPNDAGDYEYMEDFGDDALPGATIPPTS
jgi:hypothetical protein